MDGKVLVAYASKHGATAEIAERIGDVVGRAGLQADVLPASRATDPATYDGVVMGSAVYLGLWRKEAVKFVKERQEVLAQRPLWVFSCGPTSEGEAFMRGGSLPAALLPLADSLKPRSAVIFRGRVELSELNPLEKMAIRKAKAPVGELRDWDEIEAWAAGIAAGLT